MTTEIAIMNRRALVLAADSAGTVASWVNGKQEVRYFKGENKVFQLVTERPVGLMTYGNAHVLHVPWEIVVKEFRRNFGCEDLPNVRGYADRFFADLEANHLAFPADRREADFKAKVGQQIIRVTVEAFRSGNVAALDDLETKRAAFLAQVVNRGTELSTREPHASFTVGDIEKALSDLEAESAEACKIVLGDTEMWPVVEGVEDELFSTAVNLVYRSPADVASSTGIVVAGYGEQDIFPALHEFRVYGFIRERLLFEHVSESKIDAQHTGDIQSYATASTVETFTHGVNEETYSRITNAYKSSTAALLDQVESETSISIPNKDDLVASSLSAFSQLYLSDIVGFHNEPLINVVSMLAIDEMANLAETLISLESLKEKVSRPSESVGGPVDIAAITKAEGLVWVKRKHYFDLSTNPRYAAKLARSGGAS